MDQIIVDANVTPIPVSHIVLVDPTLAPHPITIEASNGNAAPVNSTLLVDPAPTINPVTTDAVVIEVDVAVPTI